MALCPAADGCWPSTVPKGDLSQVDQVGVIIVGSALVSIKSCCNFSASVTGGRNHHEDMGVFFHGGCEVSSGYR